MPDSPKPFGSLIVSATTALGTVPLPNALVTVYAQNEGNPVLYRTVRTDASGLSPVMELPAPALADSLKPDQPLPYFNYSVKVDLPNYQSVEVRDISIYPGIISTLPISLSPETSSQAPTRVNILPQETLNTPVEKEKH